MVVANNNVVSLYRTSNSPVPLNSAQVANVTAAVKSISTMHLTMLLRTMFLELDDTFFALFDETANENKKAYYHDEIRELRLKNKQIEIRLIKRFEALFSETMLLTPLHASAALNPSSRINSLQNFLNANDAELESSIMLTHFVAKANKMFKDKIDEMQTGFNYLMAGLGTENRANPLAPALISDAFKVSMVSLDDDTVQKPIIFDHFDQSVMQKLDEMYDQINALFVKLGVN